MVRSHLERTWAPSAGEVAGDSSGPLSRRHWQVASESLSRAFATWSPSLRRAARPVQDPATRGPSDPESRTGPHFFDSSFLLEKTCLSSDRESSSCTICEKLESIRSVVSSSCSRRKLCVSFKCSTNSRVGMSHVISTPARDASADISAFFLVQCARVRTPFPFFSDSAHPPTERPQQ